VDELAEIICGGSPSKRAKLSKLLSKQHSINFGSIQEESGFIRGLAVKAIEALRLVTRGLFVRCEIQGTSALGQ